MSKRYIVAVTEVGEEIRKVGKEWEPKKEIGGEKEWDYTPEIEKTCEYKREIFRQELDDLDLARLVTVINGANP